MYYTLKEICKMSGMTEHTIRYYTDKGLLPCCRDGANRRIFDDDSLNWLTAIRCLKGCGMSIESIRHYCDLCRLEDSEENLKARHYEDILAGRVPDDMNPKEQSAKQKSVDKKEVLS